MTRERVPGRVSEVRRVVELCRVEAAQALRMDRYEPHLRLRVRARPLLPDGAHAVTFARLSDRGSNLCAVGGHACAVLGRGSR